MQTFPISHTESGLHFVELPVFPSLPTHSHKWVFLPVDLPKSDGHVSRTADLESASTNCLTPLTQPSIYIHPRFTAGLFSSPDDTLLPLVSLTSFPASFLMEPLQWWTYLLYISAFISNIIHALRTVLGFEPVDLQADKDFMEELSPRQLALKQLKDQFLVALQANNAQEVLKILHTGKLDIDTVLEVDDPSMVLASYKQGEKSLVILHLTVGQPLDGVNVPIFLTIIPSNPNLLDFLQGTGYPATNWRSPGRWQSTCV